jgi:formamidopyrimidine-DNA glycosylase
VVLGSRLLVLAAQSVQIAFIVPELPEVEHARRTLEQWLDGARIDEVHVHDARILDDGVTPARVVRGLTGRRVSAVERRGKWLRLVLDEGRVFSHLGMTGKWVRAEQGEEARRFEKVRLDVTARGRVRRSVRYLDPRMFGRFVVLKESDADLPVWSELGPDPLVDGIDVGELHGKLAKRKLAIKPTLLDQSVLAGVGNILATEALFMARIDPRRPARDLSRAEVGKLARGIRRAIDATLAMQEGETIQYVEEAGAANPFTIYGQEGTPCPGCKRPLSKMVLGGRGTVLCVHCQR